MKQLAYKQKTFCFCQRLPLEWKDSPRPGGDVPAGDREGNSCRRRRLRGFFPGRWLALSVSLRSPALPKGEPRGRCGLLPCAKRGKLAALLVVQLRHKFTKTHCEALTPLPLPLGEVARPKAVTERASRLKAKPANLPPPTNPTLSQHFSSAKSKRERAQPTFP